MTTQIITPTGNTTKEQDLGFEAIDPKEAIPEYRHLSMHTRAMWIALEEVMRARGYYEDLKLSCEEIDSFMILLAKLDGKVAYTDYLDRMLERKKH